MVYVIYCLKFRIDGGFDRFVHNNVFETQSAALAAGHELTRDHVVDFFRVGNI